MNVWIIWGYYGKDNFLIGYLLDCIEIEYFVLIGFI